jgi:hypothetical protein
MRSFCRHDAATCGRRRAAAPFDGAAIAAAVLLGLLAAAALFRGPAALTPAHWIVGALGLCLLRASGRRRAVPGGGGRSDGLADASAVAGAALDSTAQCDVAAGVRQGRPHARRRR